MDKGTPEGVEEADQVPKVAKQVRSCRSGSCARLVISASSSRSDKLCFDAAEISRDGPSEELDSQA